MSVQTRANDGGSRQNTSVDAPERALRHDVTRLSSPRESIILVALLRDFSMICCSRNCANRAGLARDHERSLAT